MGTVKLPFGFFFLSSFMWSFEKIHRCMAHLFLGQLVSTFDEEFRILFAQSEPLIIENTFTPMEDYGLTQRRQYLSERPSLYKDSRKFLSPEITQSEDWGRHSYNERVDMDWRLMPKRKEIFRTPVDIYSRFPSQQLRVDPSFEQSPSRIPLMESPAFKRHGYAEGVQGRSPFLSQQVVPEPENQGRQFHRHPYLGLGKESEYSAYDKFWNQDYQLTDQYSDSTLAHEMEPPDNFDPVLNYLSSARNVEIDQGSDNMSAAAVDLPFSSPYPKRLTSGQPYACQKSPAHSKSAEQKPFFHERNPDRKDPSVKRGLRDWRISSYLSAYDSKGDEGLPLEPPNASDPFEDPSTLVPPITSRIDISTPKIPNVREFKVPAIPRASQIPGYAKNTTREQPKKLLDEPSSSVVEETKTTPSPSESSSTTDGERAEEAEVKEFVTSRLHREDSFRRKYNAAVPRCSRLRSSLIFGSLEQQQAQDGKSTPGQNEDESDKTEGEPTKQSFISQVLGQRKTTARQPFEWSSYINKSATFDNSATDSSKPDNEKSGADGQAPSKEESTEDPSAKNEESLKTPAMQQIEQTKSSPSVPRSKPVNPELPDQPIKPTKSLLGASSYIDMNDPDARLMFFKELAAKRKAAKAAEAEKSKEVIQGDQPTVKSIASVEKGTAGPEELAASIISTKTEEDKKIKEIVSIKQPMEQNNTSSGKENESSPEEMAEDMASAVTAEDKNSGEKDSVKQPTKQESGPKETIDKMAAALTSTKAPNEEESKETVSVKHPMEKHNLSAKQENLGPKESTEKMKEAVSPSKPTKEEKKQEISFKNQPADLKNSTSLILSEPAEHMTATSLFTKTPKVESKEKVAVKPQKLEANIWIKDQEFTPKETTEKRVATATSSKAAEEEEGKVSLTQPVELKSNASIEKEEPAPNEGIEETAVPTMAADTEEDKEVCVKPPADLQNLSSMKQEASGPVEQTDKMAATGEAASGAEAEKRQEKVPSKQPVKLQLESGGINKENDAEDMAEKFAAASPSTKAPKAEKTKEKVQTKQPTELINNSSVKIEEQDPKEKPERIPAEKVAEQSEDTVSSPASQSSETSEQTDVEDSLIKIDLSANNIGEIEQAQGSTDSGMINMENNPSASDSGMINTENNPSASILFVSTEPVSPPSLPPEKLGSEISSAPSAPNSSSNPADSDWEIYPGHSPLISSLHCTPTETLSSTVLPENTTKHSVNSSLQADNEKLAKQTEPEAARACQDSTSQLTSPESPSADESAQVRSEIRLAGFGGDSEANTDLPESLENAESVESRDPDVLDKTLPKSENSLLHVTEEGSKNLQVSVEGRADGTPPSLNPLKADQKGITVTSPSTAKPKYEDFPEEAQCNVVPDSATSASQSDITASSPQDPPIPALPSSEADLTGPVSPPQYETVCCLSPSEPAKPVLSPEAKEAPSHPCSPSHVASLPDQDSADLKKSPVLPSPDRCSPTEPTSKAPPVSELPCKIPEAVISENQSSEPQAPTDNSKEDSQTEISLDPETVEEKNETTDSTNSITNGQVRKNNCSEPQEVTPGDVIAPPPQSKLPKSGQSRYHSSTANVISSSNLRDDTKLLLEQISASSQSRNEASKDSPVTDDEKEDEADKNAKRAERGFISFNRGQPKSNQERDKLLEKIQSMRNERKVYSRFEV